MPEIQDKQAHDPRTICNRLLDEAESAGRTLTNLALQKLLYFAHGLHLVETTRPLVGGFFEAWQFGPVHPVAYHAFKGARDKAINFRASPRDPFTGNFVALPKCTDPEIGMRLRRIVILYGRMTPGRLVEISHAKGAPWNFIVDKARTDTIVGMRIPNDVIRERFRYHKVCVGAEPRYGEPREEAPFMRMRFGSCRDYGG